MLAFVTHGEKSLCCRAGTLVINRVICASQRKAFQKIMSVDIYVLLAALKQSFGEHEGTKPCGRGCQSTPCLGPLYHTTEQQCSHSNQIHSTAIHTHFHKSLNIKFTSFLLYLKSQRAQSEENTLCLPSHGSEQRNCHTRKQSPAPRLVNNLQLPFANTNTHWSWKTCTEHKFCKYLLFYFLLWRSWYASIIYHHCSYRSVTPFLK